MRIGKLDQRVIFAALVETNDGGSLVQSWPVSSPPDEVWAEVISERGTESFQAARVNARETIRVRVRYRADVQTSWRLTWNDRNYDVKYIDEADRRKGDLWLTAELSHA